MSSQPVPRGRHAPPLEVRQAAQRERLFDAAARVFARQGYADATAEAVAREAGMSKATFYEHFSNKEECISALFDRATEVVLGGLAPTGEREYASYAERVRARLTAIVDVVAAHPHVAQTLMVEIVGAGPEGARKRDAVIDGFADIIVADNARIAAGFGVPVYADRADVVACVAATFEVVARQLRTGLPEDPRDLVPVLERLFLGTLSQGPAPA